MFGSKLGPDHRTGPLAQGMTWLVYRDDGKAKLEGTPYAVRRAWLDVVGRGLGVDG